MIGSYDMKLIILSVVIAIVSTFTLLNIIFRVTTLKLMGRNSGVVTGSLILALGIWAMHFIGMLAYNQLYSTYNLGGICLSFLLALITSFTLYLIIMSNTHFLFLLIGTFIMAVGIIGMHLLGIISVGMISIKFNWYLFACSILLSLFVSAGYIFLAFSIIKSEKYHFIKILVSSILMGIGLSSVHYLAMEAMIIHETNPSPFFDSTIKIALPSFQISPNVLAYLLGLAIMMILSTIIALTYSDNNRDEFLLREYKNRLQKVEQDLIDILRRQQGFTLKYTKVGDQFIHTFGEGELLYKLGLTPSMVVGKSLYEILPKEVAQKKSWAYSSAWDGKITYYEVNLNGIDYYVSLSPVFRNGKVVEVISSGVDVTQRKMAEKNLADSEIRYKDILSLMPVGIFIYKANHQKIVINENAYRMFGIDLETFEKINFERNDLSLIDENGTPLEKDKYPITITLKTGESILDSVIGIKEEERTTWLSINTKLLLPFGQDNIPQVLVTMSDITDQKETEIKLRESNALRRTMIDSLPIGMVVINNDHKVVALNHACKQLFNINIPYKDVIGQSSYKYYHDFYKNEVEEKKRVNQIIKENKSRTDEIEVSRDKFIKRSYFPFYIDNEIKGHLWTFEDITERKAMEKNINHSKEEAINANLAKSKFLSNMSHELRTPLNGILGFSQLLELDNTLNEKQQMFIQEILKGGRHLLDLINEILDLSRIETGKLKISYDLIKVGEVIDECVSLIGLSARKNGIEVKLHRNNCFEKYLYIDQIRLRQIIINLLDNAIKYNKENGKIIITCECKSNYLHLHIIDTGIGIPAVEQKHIFEPFYRIGHSQIEGTGIGLSLVKQLIHLMGGDIGVKSQMGEGSDFWISVPLISNKGTSNNEIPNKMSFSLPINGEYNVLYVEDHPLNLALVQEIIETIPGMKLSCAQTGKEGLQLIQEQRFDLLLVDINLPDINGLEMLERIKSIPLNKNIPVIAVSANAMKSDIHHALDKGFSYYLTKPIDVSEFLRVITEHLLFYNSK